MAKSIDDITPEQWNEINRKHLKMSKDKPSAVDDAADVMSKYDNPAYEDPEMMADAVKQSLDYPSVLSHDDVDYIYSEGDIIREIKDYIDSTYNQHYSKNKFQATEFIIDGGHGEGFCIGNILKYAQRYGNKDGYNRKDLMKVIHYAIIMLHVHDHLGRK
tara:strand:- start:693 stop:1172 length:480 start_codon:yes stop_codon:yes gene_type:complete